MGWMQQGAARCMRRLCCEMSARAVKCLKQFELKCAVKCRTKGEQGDLGAHAGDPMHASQMATTQSGWVSATWHAVLIWDERRAGGAAGHAEGWPVGEGAADGVVPWARCLLPGGGGSFTQVSQRAVVQPGGYSEKGAVTSVDGMLGSVWAESGAALESMGTRAPS
jgi:hypothetical protein